MKDDIYQLHANTLVRQVHPSKDVNYLINIFMKDASINMGSDFTDETMEKCIYIVNTEFSFLPVSLIASAFARGSMGKFGPGRLIPRTVFTWLTEAANELVRLQAHDAIRKDGYLDKLDTFKYPAGKAIIKKIAWLKDEVITEAEYDLIPLMEVADRISQGLDVVPELWGVQSKIKDKNK